MRGTRRCMRASLEELLHDHLLEEQTHEGRPSLEDLFRLMRPSFEELSREGRPSQEELLQD